MDRGGFVMPEFDIHPKVLAATDLVHSVFRRLPCDKKKDVLPHFAGEELELLIEWYPDDRIHKCAPGDDRANFRSATPEGFSFAVFLVNAPHLKAPANDNRAVEVGLQLCIDEVFNEAMSDPLTSCARKVIGGDQ